MKTFPFFSKKGLEREHEEKLALEKANSKKNIVVDLNVQTSRAEILENLQNTGLNLEYETETNLYGMEAAPEPALYETGK